MKKAKLDDNIDEKIEEKIYSDDNIGVTVFKCQNCGGETIFEPNSQKMKCLYCGSMFDINNLSVAKERDLDELLKSGNVWDETEVYQCKTCGAKEILSKQEVSVKCSFCGTNNIIKTDEIPGIKPQGVTPFKLDKIKANEIAVKWARKKLYAPRNFKKSVKAENIYGIYNPVFTFDSQTITWYRGVLGKNYVKYRVVNGKRVAHTETRYFNINGSQDMLFDDLIVQSSTSIPSEIIKSIEPFPTKNAVAYKTEFLRGYSATTYNKSGEECWNECKIAMKERIERAILKRYDYDIKVSLNIDTKYLNEQYKFILVPIYVGHYNYKEKLYNFYVNGYNGRIGGKTPVSKLKVSFTVLFVLLLIAGVIFILMYF